ncbi:MAG: histidine phosphatase family protein [Candidatus Obscuribacterales bacterium]|nr:histidine phosphatase family protein [Candidatus Obscuribacterales bacterium]
MRKTLLAVVLFASLSIWPCTALARHKYKTPPAAQTTERVLIMRHAEKPDKSNDNNLAFAGYTRARNLPPYITSQFGRPDYIFVAADSKHSSRCTQTALPLSQETGVPLSDSFRDEDYQKLAQALTQDPQFKNKLIVVVWHHEKLPALVHALGVKDGTFPNKWKSSVYNQIWELDFVGKHRPLVTIANEPF